MKYKIQNLEKLFCGNQSLNAILFGLWKPRFKSFKYGVVLLHTIRIIVINQTPEVIIFNKNHSPQGVGPIISF